MSAAKLAEASGDLLHLHDQRIPLRERKQAWEALRAALAAYEAEAARLVDTVAAALKATDGMALTFHRSLTDGALGASEQEDIKKALQAVFNTLDGAGGVARPECCVCGATKGLYEDGWYGYRCRSDGCVVL